MDNNHTLETLRAHLGITKKEFASKLGITQNAYTNYISGKRNIPTNLVLKIKQLFDISIEWLLTGKGEMFLKDSTPAKTDNTDDIEVNFYEDVAASAGYGTTNYDTAPTRIPLSTLFLKTLGITNPNNVEVIKVYGDSMEPDFFNGEYVVVERTTSIQEVKNGNTVIVNFDGDIYIKKILKEPFENRVTLISNNTLYKPIVVEDDALHVLNIVAVVKGKFRPV